MRAVNLVPSDLRRAGSGGGSGSGASAYVLLGVLALACVVLSAWAFTARQVKDREAEVTRLNAEAAAAEQQAADLAGYEKVAQVAKARRAEVDALLDGRKDWAAALDDLSRTLGDGVWLTGLSATALPGIAVEGAASNPQRAAVQAPAVEITGCTRSQDAVAVLMSRLRSMKGVSKVGLSSSEKAASGGSGSTGAASDSASGGESADCTANSDERPKFAIVVFYGDGAVPATGTTAAAGTTGTTTTPTTTTPTTTTPATPAASTSATGSSK